MRLVLLTLLLVSAGSAAPTPRWWSDRDREDVTSGRATGEERDAEGPMRAWTRSLDRISGGKMAEEET